MSRPYYVYALKDPRQTPTVPFYIGKGTGSRAWDHVIRVDATMKGKRIKEILDSGADVMTTKLVESLTENEAIKVEAELISAFGTMATGGLLTNTVVPTGKARKLRPGLNIPSGATEKAQIGLELLKTAIVELAKANRDGVTNADVAKGLGLQSDYSGGSKDYLSFSLIGILMRNGLLARDPKLGKGKYAATSNRK
jgi:hypothetical protein